MPFDAAVERANGYAGLSVSLPGVSANVTGVTDQGMVRYNTLNANRTPGPVWLDMLNAEQLATLALAIGA